MCGRFTLSKSTEELASEFELESVPVPIQPRYNLAPSQLIAVVGQRAIGTRGLALLNWGLVRGWEKSPRDSLRPINARSETIREKPMFRDLIESRRCIIPADGFYEWLKQGKQKIPHHIRLKSKGIMGFAGLWDTWTNGTDKLATCCVITTQANELLRPLHERMPVILERKDFGAWLNPTTSKRVIDDMMRTYPEERMETFRVSSLVNKGSNDGPELLEREQTLGDWG